MMELAVARRLWLRVALVPLLVLGVLALGALVLFGGGDTDPADTTNDTLADPSPSPSAETEPTPGSPAPTATPRPTPTTTPTPVDVDEVLDVSALPPTEATHLAVLKGNDVEMCGVFIKDVIFTFDDHIYIII